MKKMKYLVVTIIFCLVGLPAFSFEAQAVNQFGYPEAKYNGTMNRWETDLSESSLYENIENMEFYNDHYWNNDPVSKNMIYNTKSFIPGVGGYNLVAIRYPADNGSWRAVYLLYVGPVKVQYLEVGTNNSLSPATYLSGGAGDTYNAQMQPILGYQLDNVVGSETGTFNYLGADYGSAGNPNLSSLVTYYYKKAAVEGKVTVKYVDESGNEISNAETLTGNVGESYMSNQKGIDGYTFKEVEGNPTGIFSGEEQIVTYMYTMNRIAQGKVTVKYVDESGNEISNAETLTGNVGESYMSNQKGIDGYTFKEVEGNPTGMFSGEEQIVTYIYTKTRKDIDKNQPSGIIKSEGNNTNSKNYPKTGETNNKLFSVLGISLLMSLILLALFKKFSIIK